MQIANPIYDVVFKYSMKNGETVNLKVLLSTDDGTPKKYPEKYRPIIRKLQKAVLDADIKKTMDLEDGLLDELDDLEREIEDLRETNEKERAEKERERAEKEKAEQENESLKQELEQLRKLLNNKL